MAILRCQHDWVAITGVGIEPHTEECRRCGGRRSTVPWARPQGVGLNVEAGTALLMLQEKIDKLLVALRQSGACDGIPEFEELWKGLQIDSSEEAYRNRECGACGGSGDRAGAHCTICGGSGLA